MPFLAPIERTATIGTAEYSILVGTTTGVPTSQTTEAIIEVFLDLSNLVAGDQFEVNMYEAAVSGGTQRKLPPITFSGVTFPPIQALTPLHFKNSYDITIRKLTGTDRSITMSARRVG